MSLTVTVNNIAECLRTDCNILGDNKKKRKTGVMMKPTPFCVRVVIETLSSW